MPVCARTAALTTAAALSLACLAPAAAADAAEPRLTEIHYDNSGTDVGEAVEVSAEPGTDLTGWSVVLYNGNDGKAYGTRALSGRAPREGGVTLDYPTNGIQNGAPDGLALVRPDRSVAQLLSYEGTFTAVDGPAIGMRTVDVGVAQSGAPDGDSLQLVDGRWTLASPRTFVRPAAPADCDVAPTTTAMAVQGTGAASPVQGTSVVLDGTVVADLQAPGGFRGFFLQDARGDGDPATSDALFVFAPDGPDVAVGDRLQVSGRVSEFDGLTQVQLADVDVCGTGGALPAAVALGLPADDAARERLEGMRVLPGELTVTDLFGLDRFGELALAQGGALRTPTDVAEPGADAQAVAASNARRKVLLDDGLNRNLQRAGQAPPHLTADDPVRVGDRAVLEDVVLSYGFGAWRLQPADGTAEGTTFLGAARPAQPDDVGGRVRLASFNVLNYFTTLSSQDADARGAETEQERARQEAKIVSAVNRLDADVVALMEIENSARLGEQPDEALAALVQALNAAAGEGTWAYVPSAPDLPPAAEQDVITNALIYRPATVGLWRTATALTDAPGTPEAERDWDNAREPIAQTFVARGDRFTVVANHFKSKSASGATGANVDSGQGAYNADRTAQAEALAAWTEELRARSDDEDVLLLGDLNAYTREDPVDVLTGAGFADLAATFADGDTSYVFNGEAGSLDHALATTAMAQKVTGVDVWGINSPESYAYQYDGVPGLYRPDPFRASDHDPVVVGFEPVPGSSRG